MNLENRPAVIEAMTEQLRGLWEAQPTLSLAEVWSQLGGLGVSLGSSDAEIAAAMTELAALHPGSVAAAGWGGAGGSGAGGSGAGRSLLVSVENPVRAVTMTTDGMLIARSREAQTVVWPVGRVLSSRAGAELVVEDESGVIHRLGLVQRITWLERRWELFGGGLPGGELSGDGLSGLVRSGLGDAVFVAAMSDGTIATIGHAVRIDSMSRRTADVQILRGWERVERCEVGEALLVREAGGSETRVGAEVGVGGAVVVGVWRVE